MINTVTSTTGTSAADAAMKQSTGLNKDDFLKLFVTQLQNQDPLNPQDSSQFIAQLAQLTQVEQSYNANSNLQALLNQGNNAAAMNSVSFIGKEVQAPGAQVGLTAGSPASINFDLAQAASQVTVTLQDGTGATVKTITAGAKGAGATSVSWDGTSDAGSNLPSGAYSYSVSAKDASGNTIPATTYIRGKVDGVDMSGTTPVLSVGGVKLSLSEITQVNGGV